MSMSITERKVIGLAVVCIKCLLIFNITFYKEAKFSAPRIKLENSKIKLLILYLVYCSHTIKIENFT